MMRLMRVQFSPVRWLGAVATGTRLACAGSRANRDPSPSEVSKVVRPGIDRSGARDEIRRNPAYLDWVEQIWRFELKVAFYESTR